MYFERRLITIVVSLRRLKGVIKDTILFASVVTETQLLITSHKAVLLEYPPVSKYGETSVSG